MLSIFVKKNFQIYTRNFPANINLFKVINGKTTTMCKIYSKLTVETPERCIQSKYGKILTRITPHTTIFHAVYHCIKSVRIRSFSGLHFPTFGLNTGRYSISLRIQSKCGKMRTRKTPNMDSFHEPHCILRYDYWFKTLKKFLRPAPYFTPEAGLDVQEKLVVSNCFKDQFP